MSWDNALIKKQMICTGKKYIKMRPGTRVKFHFKACKASDGTLLDDSREMGTPMVLVLGKKFKLEVWETIVQNMSLDEIAKFTVDKTLVFQYPFISRTLRNVDKKPKDQKNYHCCSMTLQNNGIGYADLDDLLSNPSDLEFTINLFSIEQPEDYEKERWQMSDEEKYQMISILRENGNQNYRKNHLNEAEECYRQAVGIVEQLMAKEKPHDTEWLELADTKVPLLLNYSQCRLIAGDYYAVIMHCNEVLVLNPNSVKAYFRRAKAHFGAWNPEAARRDFQQAVALDKSLQNAVAKELRAIDKQQRLHDIQDKLKMQKLF